MGLAGADNAILHNFLRIALAAIVVFLVGLTFKVANSPTGGPVAVVTQQPGPPESISSPPEEPAAAVPDPPSTEKPVAAKPGLPPAEKPTPAEPKRPPRVKPAPATPRLAPAEILEFETRDGVIIHATFLPGSKGKDTVPRILLHDWQGSRNDHGTLAQYLQAQGYAVLVPDLRGHGDSIRTKNSVRALQAARMPATSSAGWSPWIWIG